MQNLHCDLAVNSLKIGSAWSDQSMLIRSTSIQPELAKDRVVRYPFTACQRSACLGDLRRCLRRDCCIVNRRSRERKRKGFRFRQHFKQAAHYVEFFDGQQVQKLMGL